MIELRWLSFDGGHRVLQQRTKYVKQEWNTLTETKSNVATWTDWTDIPVHLCAIVNGERKVLERAL